MTASVFLPKQASAQSPEKMSYQAVIRNSSDALLTNKTVGMQISILQGSASGLAVYVENQAPTTNINGLVSIEIGDGTVISGAFATIDWANGPYFIKTETDPTGGTSYTITGTSQLLSVPYAMHAKTAERFTDVRNDSAIWNANKLQGQNISNDIPSVNSLLKWTGTQWTPSPNTDLSHWEKSGNYIFTTTDSVGIGRTKPLVGLHVRDNVDVLFGDSTAGAGSRFYWVAGKGALRSGSINSTQWNSNLIGTNSVAFGRATIASGDYSTAMGEYTTASGTLSTAMGGFTTAPSGYETVIGRYNTTYTPALTIGWNTSDRLFVIGNGTSSIQQSNAMVVLKNGNTGIGNSNPQELLHVGTGTGATLRIGNFENIQDDGGFLLAFNATLTPIANGGYNLGNSSKRWNTVYATNGTINTSDVREKHNINTIPYGLDALLKLNPVSYYWNNDLNPGMKLGLVAQELKKIIPEVVVDREFVITNEETGEGEWRDAERMGVFYSDLIPVLVKGIQEQQEQIEAQKQENYLLMEKIREQELRFLEFNQSLLQQQAQIALLMKAIDQ